MKFENIIEQTLNGLSQDKSLDFIAKKHQVSLEDIQKEHKMGIEVEMEHTSSWDVAAQIAKDHLYEDPEYYTKLNQMEKR